MEYLPPRGPIGFTHVPSSAANGPVDIFDESQVRGPEPNRYAETSGTLRDAIPKLYNTYIFYHDNAKTKETWERVLRITHMTSEKEVRWVMNMISDVMTNLENTDSHHIARLKRFLLDNVPRDLRSPYITQPQHTQHLCALLESLHSRISALEARRA
jgi:hypothetical protein